MRYIANISVFTLALLTFACSNEQAAEASANNATDTTKASTEALPPGFTDEPPPAPTSNTSVLSGGNLVFNSGDTSPGSDDSTINDSVIVITNGKLVAWGKRGETDMPNDSIGYDLRGKWITSANIMRQGGEAELSIYSADPTTPAATTATTDLLVGAFANNQLSLDE